MNKDAWCVIHFVVPMYFQTPLEEFVGQSDRLGKAINASDDPQVDVPVFDFSFQVVFFNEIVGDEGGMDPHVLWVVERCGKVKIIGIRHGITCAICRDGRVPHDFCGGEIGRAHCKFVGVINEVPPPL